MECLLKLTNKYKAKLWSSILKKRTKKSFAEIIKYVPIKENKIILGVSI